MNKKNTISSILNNSNNLINIFNYYLKNFPDKNFLFSKKNKKWEGHTFLDISKRINKIAAFLIENGLKKGDRIFLLSENRLEWVEFDLAIMSIGCICVPSFVTNNVEDNHFIITDCKPKLIILENQLIYKNNKSKLKKINSKKIILIDEHPQFTSYKKIINQKKRPTKSKNLIKSDISTIIYTSGTSGKPKGVVLTYESILHNLKGALEIISDFNIQNEKFLSFLPLSHSYERMAGLYFPLLIGAEIFFCSSMDKIMTEIKEVKPTILSAVPRLYESIFKKIKSQINKSNFFLSFFLKKVFSFTKINQKNSILDTLLCKLFIFLILKRKLKKNFGNNIKAFVSGGAPLNPDVGNFFNIIGFNLLQGYGQTEAAPLISCNKRYSNNPETVGFPIKNTKVKISPIGEILVKGKNVMLGYWNKKKLTNKTIVKGWLHTGDLGYFDKIGRLIINGRKKDLIVTSGGDNISAQKIESFLNSFPEILQVAIFGDRRPYLIALVVRNENIEKYKIDKIIKNTNKKMNSIEKIRKYLIIDQTFTYENGLLTQTQKIKKDKVFDSYKKQINNLYGTL